MIPNPFLALSVEPVLSMPMLPPPCAWIASKEADTSLELLMSMPPVPKDVAMMPLPLLLVSKFELVIEMSLLFCLF